MQEIKIQLADLVPKHWLENGSVDLLMSVYTCLLPSADRLGGTYIAEDIGNVRYVILEGALPYIAADMRFQGMENGIPKFHTNISQQNTPSSFYIVFFAKMDNDAAKLIESARGFVYAIEGVNAAYTHAFDQILTLPENKITSHSPAIKSPSFAPVPFIEMKRMPQLAVEFEKMDQVLRDRVRLALRWYSKSNSEEDPVDAFLKVWFALEVLAMPNDTEIYPIEDFLSQIYGKTRDEVKKIFKVGRIFGLRSKIVHEGLTPPIHGQLQKYVEAIFVDVFFHLIGQPSEKRAEAILNNTQFSLVSWQP